MDAVLRIYGKHIRGSSDERADMTGEAGFQSKLL
jgi:hypothetical protein